MDQGGVSGHAAAPRRRPASGEPSFLAVAAADRCFCDATLARDIPPCTPGGEKPAAELATRPARISDREDFVMYSLLSAPPEAVVAARSQVVGRKQFCAWASGLPAARRCRGDPASESRWPEGPAQLIRSCRGRDGPPVRTSPPRSLQRGHPASGICARRRRSAIRNPASEPVLLFMGSRRMVERVATSMQWILLAGPRGVGPDPRNQPAVEAFTNWSMRHGGSSASLGRLGISRRERGGPGCEK